MVRVKRFARRSRKRTFGAIVDGRCRRRSAERIEPSRRKLGDARETTHYRSAQRHRALDARSGPAFLPVAPGGLGNGGGRGAGGGLASAYERRSPARGHCHSGTGDIIAPVGSDRSLRGRVIGDPVSTSQTGGSVPWRDAGVRLLDREVRVELV